MKIEADLFQIIHWLRSRQLTRSCLRAPAKVLLKNLQFNFDNLFPSLVLLFFLLFLLPISIFGQVDQNLDFQLWLRDSFEQKISKKDRLRVDAEFRYGDNGSILYRTFTQFLWQHQYCTYFSLEPGYRHVRALRINARRWITIHQPFFQSTFFGKSKYWTFSDRNRFEIEIPEDIPERWIYRNRLQIEFVKKIAHFQPYVSDEFFIRQEVGLHQNRLIFGLGAQFDEHIRGDIYYMLRHLLIGDEWRVHNILGLTVLFSF